MPTGRNLGLYNKVQSTVAVEKKEEGNNDG